MNQTQGDDATPVRVNLGYAEQTPRERSTIHSTFVIERTYDASPKRVFDAWADPAAKPRRPGHRRRARDGTNALMDALGALVESGGHGA